MIHFHFMNCIIICKSYDSYKWVCIINKQNFLKEEKVLFNDAFNTFYLRLYGKGSFR